MKTLRRTVVFFALVAASGTAAAGLLDGRRFVGDTGPAGRAADEHGAVLTFAQGTFSKSSPASCASDSFDPGAYSAAEEGGAIRFRATTTSDEYGRIEWQGIVRDGVAEGTLVWYRKPSVFVPEPRPYPKWFKARSTN